MLTLPVPIENVLLAFAPLFTRPVWHHVRLLLLGAILARGKRTVTSALRAVGYGQVSVIIDFNYSFVTLGSGS